jgi:hypothetical protein
MTRRAAKLGLCRALRPSFHSDGHKSSRRILAGGHAHSQIHFKNRHAHGVGRGKKLSTAIASPRRFSGSPPGSSSKEAATALAHHLQRLRSPRDAQLVLQSILVIEAIELAGFRGLSGESDQQHRYVAALPGIAPPAGEDPLTVLHKGWKISSSLAREEFIRQGPPPGEPPPRATISTFTRARQGNRVF